ncbi:MAG: phytase [Bacteroidales bacterium]
MKHFSIFIFCSLLLFYSCHRPSEGSKKAGKHIPNTVSAKAETTPVPQGKNDDAADDPAIWINNANPDKSIIIGTDKKGGLATYNLQGKELFYYPAGKMNNCDLRYGFVLYNELVDVLAASNRSNHSLSLFQIHENGTLDTLHAGIISSKMKKEVYGLCMYKSRKTGDLFVFMNSKSGEIEQWLLMAGAGNKIDAKLVRAFSLGTQTEGMVADDETGILYIGAEQSGIYKYDAEPDGPIQGTRITNSSEENLNITYDIEGLAIYDSGNGNGYLVASSQGNYSYAIFERQGDNKYLGSFKITDGKIDGVEETDGIEITSAPLGRNFPKGALIVQDGYNYDGIWKKSQNFKIVSWEQVEKLTDNF